MVKKVILWVIVLLLTLQLVAALGIRPAKTEIISDETSEYSGSIWIVNNDNRKFNVEISVEGAMSEYVKVKPKALHFNKNDKIKTIDFEMHLPKVVPPGESITKILITQKLISTDKNVISSRLVLKHKIVVKGSYPDKYVSIDINFFDNNDKIRMVSEVKNLGKEDINNIQTKFYIDDKEQEQHVLETGETALKKSERKLLDVEINRSLFEKGEYEVAAITFYDDLEIELNEILRLGKPEIDITYFNKYFVAHTINEYSMDLLNLWNRKIKNIFVDVEVKKNEQEVDGFRTKSVDIEGLTTERIEDYFDARNKEVGEYTFDMVVNFWNNYRMESKRFQGELVSEDDYYSLTSAAVHGREGSGFTTIFVIVISLVIFIGFISYVLWRYKRNTVHKKGK